MGKQSALKSATCGVLDVWRSEDGSIELRLGRWQEALADVLEADALITDPPYSERTHKGALSTGTLVRGVDGYGWWTDEDVAEVFESWASRVRSWMVFHNDDVLGPAFIRIARELGRYAFPLLPVLQHQPRTTGDGPPQHGHYLAVSRPSERRFLGWGSLPGWYGPHERDGSIVKGGKPLALMQQIVSDYSQPGDLIVDPCAGGATTLLAAGREGRRAIGAECDPATFAKAVARLEKEARTGIWRPSGARMKQAKLF